MTKLPDLNDIAAKVTHCHNCNLYKTATNPVPGEGNPEAEVMFIGEAPGYFEDLQGRPFVGQAGKLLDKLLQSIKLSREEVFICNMLRHRPPENRDPLPEEIKACEVFLDDQIKIINPKVIVTLGRFSMNKFLPGEYISNVHGQARYVDFAGQRYIIIPMYHPAAALRNGAVMDKLVADFKKITTFLKEPEVETEAPKQEEVKKHIQLSLIN
ncbi:uracil-DNA glycosylase [Candidatus Shapirobacteria bacterium CG09_land_8_20_14_0_10_47_13]|uniref:Type-4 uracil-DNA glycosylase n=1 Tax=Candidatus Shapirobacteria bacterium CG09_land_8_20_14_0_10_47_13 TaxID=1974481 RepID=A0A2H0WN89_9BACT|nr:MAG: uracil-DNA glycosylase [Candidatus Shapirobacteria bacterium CG09_land_8_20_14_0_10_47_13]